MKKFQAIILSIAFFTAQILPTAQTAESFHLAPPSGITFSVDIVNKYEVTDEKNRERIREFQEEIRALESITTNPIKDYILGMEVFTDDKKKQTVKILLDNASGATEQDDLLTSKFESVTNSIFDTKDVVEIKQSNTLAEMTEKVGRSKGIVFLPGKAEVFVVGDTHGDTESTRSIIKKFESRFEGTDNNKPYIVFLGNYVNNGLASIDNLIEVLTLKNKHPDNVVVLSGNHEFGETYATAVKEMFSTHWDNAGRNRYPNKGPPAEHYGHIRFELIQKYGFKKGEEIYKKFVEWGRSLPYICMVPSKRIMMSHSVGLPEGKENVNLKELNEAKEKGNNEKWNDKTLIDDVGYEAWKKLKITIHSAMVNNREFTPELVKKFANLEVKTMIVGHTHFRSGAVDTEFYDPDHKKPVEVPGIQLITVCSSRMDSPDAGHYMFQEQVVEAKPDTGKVKEGEPVNGARYKERVEKNIPNREGNAEAFYLAIAPSEGAVDLEVAKMSIEFSREYYKRLKDRIENAKISFSINPEAAIKEFCELAIQINYLKPSTDAEKQLFDDLLVERSDAAKEISLKLMEDERKTLREVLEKKAIYGLGVHTDFMVSTEKITKYNGEETLGKTKMFIGEWLDPKNNIPSYIRQAIYRGMLEGRYEDLLYAFGFGWRQFGTAGIRNQAVMSEFEVLLKKELEEFAENPHAPILTGPNMINAVTLLQQVAALTKIIKDFQEKIKGIGDINQAAEELDIDPEFAQNIKDNTVTIAYDSRLNGKYFAHLLAAAFLTKGIKVNLFDAPAGVPAGAAAAKGSNFFGPGVLNIEGGGDVQGSVFGILISASHSEAHYNGFKAFLGYQVSQVDAETKKMIMNARDNIKYKNMEQLMALDSGNVSSFDSIMKKKGRDLTWFGKNRSEYNRTNYPNARYVVFYDDYYGHLLKRSPLFLEDSSEISEVKKEMRIVYSAFYGVGAKGAADIADFLNKRGFESIQIVEKQTNSMDGRFPGHVSPDPGVPAGWNSNILQYLAQNIKKAGDFFVQLEKAIMTLNNTYMAATDPDADRAGIMLPLPGAVPGNVKKQFIKWIEANQKMVCEEIFEITFSEDEFDKLVNTFESKFEDMLLLTANEAWTMLAYYKLLIREEANKLEKNKLYTILKSHVTTDGLEQVAEHFRENGYKVYVVNTYVGYTELAKKSRDLFAIAETASRIVVHLNKMENVNVKDEQASTDELNKLKVKLEKQNSTLKSRVPPETSGIPIIDEAIAYLDKDMRKNALAKLEIISRMENIIACEESNGYGELGEYVPDFDNPENGKVVDAHIADKDGGLALYEFFEMLAWGKVKKKMSGYELFNDILKTIGYCATDNQMAKYPGVSGMQEKVDAIQSMEMDFSIISGKALDRGQPIMLYGKYELKRIEIFRDAKNESVCRGFPEEGERLVMEKDGCKMTATFRPSGTGDSNRVYCWVYGEVFNEEKHKTVEKYRQKVLGMIEELRNHFFGVPAVREGFAEKPDKYNPSLLWELKMKGTRNHKEVIRDALRLPEDQMTLTKAEEKLIAAAKEYGAANKEMKEDEKIKATARIKKARQENLKAWNEYLASTEAKDYPVKQRVEVCGIWVNVPKAFVGPLKISLQGYLSEMLVNKALKSKYVANWALQTAL